MKQLTGYAEFKQDIRKLADSLYAVAKCVMAVFGVVLGIVIATWIVVDGIPALCRNLHNRAHAEDRMAVSDLQHRITALEYGAYRAHLKQDAPLGISNGSTWVFYYTNYNSTNISLFNVQNGGSQ